MDFMRDMARRGRGEESGEDSVLLDLVCPECGLILEEGMIWHHLGTHWDKEPHPIQAKVANERYNALKVMAKLADNRG